MSERSRAQPALMWLGTAIILVCVIFAFLRLLNPPQSYDSLIQNLGELVYVIIQVLFLAVAIWGGTILLDRGLHTPQTQR